MYTILQTKFFSERWEAEIPELVWLNYIYDYYNIADINSSRLIILPIDDLEEIKYPKECSEIPQDYTTENVKEFLLCKGISIISATGLFPFFILYILLKRDYPNEMDKEKMLWEIKEFLSYIQRRLVEGRYGGCIIEFIDNNGIRGYLADAYCILKSFIEGIPASLGMWGDYISFADNSIFYPAYKKGSEKLYVIYEDKYYDSFNIEKKFYRQKIKLEHSFKVGYGILCSVVIGDDSSGFTALTQAESKKGYISNGVDSVYIDDRLKYFGTVTHIALINLLDFPFIGGKFTNSIIEKIFLEKYKNSNLFKELVKFISDKIK